MIPRKSVKHMPEGPSLTKQSMALETDVNVIVARHVAHGSPFPVNSRAQYGDFTSGGTFHESLSAVREAELTFMSLPAAVRDYCANDPGRFLDLVHDESRRDELVKLGLVPEAVPVTAPETAARDERPSAPPPVPPVPPTPPA